MLRRTRMVPVAAAAWLTAGVMVAAPVAAGLWAWAGAALAAGAAASVMVAARRDRGREPARRRRPWRAAVTPLAILAVASAAAGAVCVSVALAEPARAGAAAFVGSGGRSVEAEIVVTGKREPASFGGIRFVAETASLTVGGESRRFAVPVEVQAGTVPADLDVGARLTVRGRAGLAEPGERAVLSIDADTVGEVTAPSGILAWTSHLRRQLASATEGLPEPGGGLVPGLAVGDTAFVAPALDEAMKTASLSHLTAVSGANCVIVVGIAMGIAALLGLRRGWRVVAGMVALGFFVVLVTPEASVVRAAVMAAVAMAALLLGRPAAGLSLLAVAVTAVLVLDPWMARSLGFALSAAATAALLTLARPLTAGLSRLLPRGLALAIAVPLSAQLACGPLLLLIRPEVSLAGVAANLLAGPAASVATVVGLAACLAAPLPVVQAGLAALAWLPAAWIAGVATTTAALPGGAVPWLDGPVGVASLVVVSAVAVVAVTGVVWRGRARPRVRAAAVAVIAVLGGAGVGQWTLTTVAAPWTVPADWSIAACDVGQGDALVVRSAGRTMLIDTGPAPEPTAACLHRLGLDRVDVLVLTHFDLDHVGGADAVTSRVGLLLHGPPAARSDERVLARVRAEQVQQASAGMSGTLGEARWTVVWPPPRSLAFPSGNAASVVISITGGGVPTAVFLGDLDATAERALVASGNLPARADIVKVAHHGSADQDAVIYDRLSARVALISVGAGNDYGHPRDSLLAIVQHTRATVARTDQDGLVLVAADDRGLRLWRDHRRRRGCRRGPIP